MTEQTTEPNKGENIKTICEELEQISLSVITRAKDSSAKDIAVNYEKSEVPKNIDATKVKIVSTNYQTMKSRVTFFRTYIEETIANMKGLSLSDMDRIKSYVTKNNLYVAFNLWVVGTITAEKNKLF